MDRGRYAATRGTSRSQQLWLQGVDGEPDGRLGATPSGDGGITLLGRPALTQAIEAAAHFDDIVLVADPLGDEPVVDFARRPACGVGLEHCQYLLLVSFDAASSGVALKSEPGCFSCGVRHLTTQTSGTHPLRGCVFPLGVWASLKFANIANQGVLGGVIGQPLQTPQVGSPGSSRRLGHERLRIPVQRIPNHLFTHRAAVRY